MTACSVKCFYSKNRTFKHRNNEPPSNIILVKHTENIGQFKFYNIKNLWHIFKYNDNDDDNDNDNDNDNETGHDNDSINGNDKDDGGGDDDDSESDKNKDNVIFDVIVAISVNHCSNSLY